MRRADWRTPAIGLLAGYLNGLLGIGGGIIITPGLVLLRGVDARRAVATALVLVLAMSLVALGAHMAVSGFRFSLGGTGLLLAAAAAGAQVGAALLARLPQRWILLLFAAFCVVAAGNQLLTGLEVLGALRAGAAPPPLWSYPVVGLCSGIFSGLLGLGGGGITVLFFAAFYHVPILAGVPLALLLNVTNALSGVAAQLRGDRILWREVRRLLPTVLVGIALGVGMAVVLTPQALRVLFALFFVYLGARLFQRGWRA